MKTPKMQFCLKAATSLSENDLDDLTDAIGKYMEAGVGQAQAETMAVDDLTRQVMAEREALLAAGREQFPDAFPSELDLAAAAAATSPENDLPPPTAAQKEAGNYKMGHLSLHGLDISIENPKGSERRAADDSWVVRSMPAHYGYFKRTEGADGDHVDVFIGPNPESTKVWVINQKHQDGGFDEHKVMMGFDSAADAKKAYLASFSGKFGSKVFESISAEMDVDGLKATMPTLVKAKPVKVAVDELEALNKEVMAAKRAEFAAPADGRAELTAARKALEARRDAVRRGNVLPSIDPEPAGATDTPAFRQWFRGSKVVTPDGQPMRVYRGMMGEIENDQFRVNDGGTYGPGIYFSTDPKVGSFWAGFMEDDGMPNEMGGSVYAAYVNLRNPASGEEASEVEAEFGSGAMAELIRRGYDGVMAEDGEIVAFRPEQIKSAIGNDGTFDPADPNILRSVDDQQSWYFSGLTRAIEEASTKSAPADQWLGMLKGLPAKGVKPDEIFWSGIEDWLRLQTGKIKKEDVLAYLNANGVRVEETVLGDKTKQSEADTIRVRLDALGYDVDQDYDGLGSITYRADDQEFFYDPTFNRFEDEDGNVLPENVSRLALRLVNLAEAEGDEAVQGRVPNGTRYSDYTLPGGENYREVLLTLPDSRKAVEGWSFVQVKDMGPIKPWDRGNEEKWAAITPDGDRTATFDTEAAARMYASKHGQPDRSYISGHWSQPNIIAHIRLNDRTDADGKRVLFVEEIQSDWAQQGKKQGFGVKDVDQGSAPRGWGNTELKTGVPAAPFVSKDAYVVFKDGKEVTRKDKDGKERKVRYDTQQAASAAAEKVGGETRYLGMVTNTDGWVNLALKRVMVLAVEGGYDKVAFITGEQSADRYDLSKQVDSITARAVDGGKFVIYANNRGNQAFQKVVTREEMPDLIGKDLSKRILDDYGMHSSGLGDFNRTYSGIDLKVGGEGMRTFYDSIVPKAANALLKKMGGGQIGPVKVDIASGVVAPGTESQVVPYDGRWAVTLDGYILSRHDTEAEANESNEYVDAEFWRGELRNGGYTRVPQQSASQPGFEVTDAMRQKVEAGVPLFSAKDPGSQKDLVDREAYLAQLAKILADEKRAPVQVVPRLRKLLRDSEAGKLIDPQEVQRLLDQLEARNERRAEPQGRTRGPLWVRERLLREIRRGANPEAAQLALWFVEQNPSVAEGLAISFRAKGEAAGTYDEARRLATLIEGASRGTGVHEILHHTERMMPDDVQAGIRAEWARQLKKQLDFAVENNLEPLVRAVTLAMAGRPEDTLTLIEAIRSGEIPFDFYQYVNPSEFWAVNGTRLMLERADAPGWVAQARRWLQGLIEKIKEIFGLSSDAPVLRALDAILKSDGTYLQRFGLAGGMMQFAPKPRGFQRPGKEVPGTVDAVTNVEAAFEFAGSQPFTTNRGFKLALQAAVLDAAKAAKVKLDEFTQGTERYLVRIALADAKTALRTNANAVGWYNEKVNKALRLVSLIHPEINTDPQAKFAFVWAMAVTSNGLKVDKNFELAESAYRAFKASGRMPTDIGIGTAAKAINKTLKLYNTLVDKHGFEVVERFMTTMQTVKEVEAFTGMNVSGENLTTRVYGAAALGPKIGNGFFMNLYGRFEQLTMDRWLMRTWGRWTGTLVESNPAQVRAKRTALKALIQSLDPAQKKAFESIIKRRLSVTDVDGVAVAIWKASQKPSNRERMNAVGIADAAGKERLSYILGAGNKGTVRIGFGDELRKVGNSLTKYLDGQKEAPSGPPERGNIRKVFGQVLSELQKEHPALTMSDLQALLWYPEKRLYDAAKTEDEATDGYEDDEAPDYANAAAKLARSQGISDAAIADALRSVDAEIQAALRAAGARPGQRGLTSESGGTLASIDPAANDPGATVINPAETRARREIERTATVARAMGLNVDGYSKSMPVDRAAFDLDQVLSISEQARTLSDAQKQVLAGMMLDVFRALNAMGRTGPASQSPVRDDGPTEDMEVERLEDLRDDAEARLRAEGFLKTEPGSLNDFETVGGQAISLRRMPPAARKIAREVLRLDQQIDAAIEQASVLPSIDPPSAFDAATADWPERLRDRTLEEGVAYQQAQVEGLFPDGERLLDEAADRLMDEFSNPADLDGASDAFIARAEEAEFRDEIIAALRAAPYRPSGNPETINAAAFAPNADVFSDGTGAAMKREKAAAARRNEDAIRQLAKDLGGNVLPSIDDPAADRRLPRQNRKNLEKWAGSKAIGPASEMVRVYRAVPKGSAQTEIQPGDWVTANREYLADYAGRDATVIEATIPASELVDTQTGAVARDTLIWTPPSAQSTLRSIDPLAGENGREDGTPAERAAALKQAADALNAKPEPPPSWAGPLFKDMGTFSKYAVHPRTIAAFDKAFTPIYRVAEAQIEARDRIASELANKVQAYFDLPKASKARVHAVLELGRLKGEVLSGKKMSMTNDGEPAQLSSEGEVIALSDAEKTAYWGVRNMLNDALDRFRDQALTDFGIDPQEFQGKGVSKRLIEMADAIPAGFAGNARAQMLRTAAAMVDEIEQARRTGYVPFSRFGDVVVTVKDADNATLWASKVDTTGMVNTVRKKFGAAVVTDIPAVKAEMERLRDQFRGQDVTIGAFQAQSLANGQSDVRMADIDMLAEVAQINNQEWDSVREQLERAVKAKGFRKHFFGASNTPGYSVDFERSLSDYMLGMAGYLARREALPKWDAAIGAMPTQKANLIAYAKSYRDYVQNPTEEWQRLRQFGFLWYLAGVPATALVNLTQVDLLTAPYLMQFAGAAGVEVEIQKARLEAGAMVSLNAGMDVFDPAKAPEDVREDLQQAWDEGFFVPLNTYELMGTAYTGSKGQRSFDRAFRTVTDAVAIAFTTAERHNRIASFIAAHRIARQPGVQEKVQAQLAGNALARDTLRDWSPKGFAQWTIDETHFRMGKVNRPTITRGIGAPLLQFKGYTMQALERWITMALLQGPQGKKAMLISLGLMVLMSGFWGLPGADDLRDLFEKMYKALAGKDFDTETKLREAVVELTGSPRIAQAFSKGITFPAGLDLSGRMGMGNIAPDTPLAMLGIPGDLLFARPSKFIERASQDNWSGAFAELAPNFVKNPWQAANWADRGVSTMRGKRVITPDKLDKTDIAMRAIGFQPAKVTNERERQFAERRAASSVDEMRRDYYTRVSQALADEERAIRKGDAAAAAAAREKAQKAYNDIAKHNETAEDSERIDLIDSTVRRRVAEDLNGPSAVRKQARSRAEEIREVYGSTR